jgi:ATP-binding protein involved in chromosome partitioning
MSFRTYHEVAGADRSGVLAQVQAQRERVAARLAAVRHVVLVASGKGGVGKSYITAGLAVALAREGWSVGVVDADLRSPTVAGLLAARGPLEVSAHGVSPARGAGGVAVVSSDFLLEDGQPLVWREPGTERHLWRGALEAGALREFFSDVRWGTLDLLLVDLPPGADGVTDLAGVVPRFSGAMAVTIPTDEARRSVTRAMESIRGAGIPLLGVIENMSGYRCSACATPGPLFPGDAGGSLAGAFGVPLLARLPFDPTARPADPPSDVWGPLASRVREALP